MRERKKESVGGILISRIAGFIVFLILLAVLNILSGDYVQSPIFIRIVEFLNASLGLLFLITALFLLGDLFGVLVFPLNLPAPVFNAFGAVFLVTFLFRLFVLVGEITGVEFFAVLERTLAIPVTILVFVVVLIGGYIMLVADP
ncbi:hypothetical protein F8E02_12090 [Methanoculleus sp. Wushi-C6]|uniref:Uncharacterized protein n=1 Tax=Methanoculleus caldifontis TaxID=2651577 RepID=A0ABU3X3T9_9EURY|nr:hypothetical protein [Methanoculleus sp. Wushi-C6]MDV2482722.1 hypothetical protein [Methanoculleus sp. Wushi-C6]